MGDIANQLMERDTLHLDTFSDIGSLRQHLDMPTLPFRRDEGERGASTAWPARGGRCWGCGWGCRAAAGAAVLRWQRVQREGIDPVACGAASAGGRVQRRGACWCKIEGGPLRGPDPHAAPRCACCADDDYYSDEEEEEDEEEDDDDMMMLGATPRFGNTPTHTRLPGQSLGLGRPSGGGGGGGDRGGEGPGGGAGGPGGAAEGSSDDEDHLMSMGVMGMSPDMGMRPGELAGLMHHTVRRGWAGLGWQGPCVPWGVGCGGSAGRGREWGGRSARQARCWARRAWQARPCFARWACGGCIVT